MHHSFSVLFATKYGLDEGIFIHSLMLWTASNAARGQTKKNEHFQKGRYWSFGTPEYFCQFFPYWKPRRIKDIIQSCLKQGLLIKDVFNKKGYDRTSWYSLSDSILLELNLDKTCLKPSPVLIGRNPSNGLDEIRTMDQTDFVQPIPYTETYTKTYISTSDEVQNLEDYSGQSLIRTKTAINPNFETRNLSEKIFLENHENLNLDAISDEQHENTEELENGGNQTFRIVKAKKGLDGTRSYDKSDYRKNQTKYCSVPSKLRQYDVKSILSNNIFQIPEQIIHDWIANRKKKRAAITQTAWTKINKELAKCKEQGIDPVEAFETMVASGWQSLKAEYFCTDKKPRVDNMDTSWGSEVFKPFHEIDLGI